MPYLSTENQDCLFMEDFQQQFSIYWNNLKAFALGLEPEYWAAGGGGLLLLLIWSSFGKARKKRNIKKVAPELKVHTFQVSPLGRDAFFKIRNDGEMATLSELNFIGRSDIVVKNALAGHQIRKNKIYSLLLEAASQNKIDPNFSIELTFLDTKGNVYRQAFELDTKVALPPKLVKIK